MSDSFRLHGLHSPWNSPGQNTGVGSLSLFQGIFPTQGSNPGLLHCRRILYQLNYQGSPIQYCRLFELEGPYPATHPSQEFYSVSKGSHHNLLKHLPNLETVLPVLQSFPSFFFLSFFLFGRRMFKKYRKSLEWTSTNVLLFDLSHPSLGNNSPWISHLFAHIGVNYWTIFSRMFGW